MIRDNVNILIELFWKSNPSKASRFKFIQWFLAKEFSSEKEKAMMSIWETENSQFDQNSHKALRSVNKRIKYLESAFGNWRLILKVAAIFMLPAMGSAFTYFYLHETQKIIYPTMQNVFAAYGETKQITLPDSTRVTLNAGSVLVYPDKFSQKTRTIYLSGEANFDVYKNPNRPFIVKTNYLSITAIGTVFNVESYPDGENAQVSLREGSVKVASKFGKEYAILTPNELLTYNISAGKFIKEIADSEKISAWKSGSLVFQSASFEYIMKTLQRHYNLSFNYDATKYANRHFTVTFYPNTDVDEVLEILKQMIVNFNYTQKDKSVYVY